MLLLNYRSTDYGTTYEKLNDKVGLKTILSYLYVCPTNKRKVRSVYSACCLFMMWLLSWLAHLSEPPKNPLQLSFKRYKDELMDVKVVKCLTHHNFQISSCECRRERQAYHYHFQKAAIGNVLLSGCSRLLQELWPVSGRNQNKAWQNKRKDRIFMERPPLFPWHGINRLTRIEVNALS